MTSEDISDSNAIMVNLYTKFEMPSFAHSKDREGRKI